MKQIFLTITMLFISINLYSVPPDSCLKYYFHPDPTFTNHDSVMVDSCDGSPTYGKLFAKKYFQLNFNINNFPFLVLILHKAKAVCCELKQQRALALCETLLLSSYHIEKLQHYSFIF